MRSFIWFRIVILIILGICCFPLSSNAQSNEQGQVRGTVSDSTGAVIPLAAVTLRRIPAPTSRKGRCPMITGSMSLLRCPRPITMLIEARWLRAGGETRNRSRRESTNNVERYPVPRRREHQRHRRVGTGAPDADMRPWEQTSAKVSDPDTAGKPRFRCIRLPRRTRHSKRWLRYQRLISRGNKFRFQWANKFYCRNSPRWHAHHRTGAGRGRYLEYLLPGYGRGLAGSEGPEQQLFRGVRQQRRHRD